MAEGRLERIERKVDVLTDGMATLAVRVNGLDEKFNGLDQKFNGLDQKFNRLDQKVDRLDQKVDRLDAKMDAGFKRLDKRLDSIETTQIAINRELSDRDDDHERRIAALEKKA